MTGTYALIARLPVIIDSYSTGPMSRSFGPELTRHSRSIQLEGGGEQGVGEDATPFEPVQLRPFPELEVTGTWTIDSFAAHLESLDLYPGDPLPPGFPTTFRRWGLESAALDLALKQAGASLAEVLERPCRPLRFVNSPLLGPDPVGPLQRRLELQPALHFKLDPRPDWTREAISDLAATGAVDVIDFKGQYPPQAPIAVAPEASLYARLAEGFPDAWLEDPGFAPGCREALAAHLDRITWDLRERTPADIDRLPIPPRAINIKPGRHGSLRALLDVYDTCAERGLPTYGGGMGELGAGRDQIQYLASMFHPDAPNDVAPVAYNEPELAVGLPSPPLVLEPARTGFGLS